ncbi:cation:proton antiporter [Micromonospora eburnea]|uniref:Kef-type K+ transport system, membrane component KefB n=1 Tax=Micromonospora eburnea TaxID=227316 RepID=A0A1C6UG00_9ACTN|nr:cation:proton antiporter [Micromonospora eburnea]SCL52871.1 Kef-type K+ transport system, membrane component KefB [Micromonospora eburnea]
MQSLASNSELTIATVLADVAIVLIVGHLFGRWLRRMGQPVVIGEILAGIALGPSLLGLLPGNPTEVIFPAAARPYLSAISQVGLLLFMFLVGWEFDRRVVARRKVMTLSVSLASIALAFTLGVGLASLIYADHAMVAGKRVPFVVFALFLGAAMSITAFPVLARILKDRGLVNTEVGTLALASAAIDDVLAWCILALVAAIAAARDGTDLIQIAALSLAYVAVMSAVVRPLLAAVVRRVALLNRPANLAIFVAAGVFLSSFATTWVGIHAIFGAFAFGFIMPREPAEELRQQIREPFENIGMVLLPVFFIVTGLGVDIASLTLANYVELSAIILVACVGKTIGAATPALALGLPGRDARTLGILMNTRGLTELIVLNVGVSLGVLDKQMFTMMVIMALVTTAMAGPLLPKLARTPPTGRVPGAPRDSLAANAAKRT